MVAYSLQMVVSTWYTQACKFIHLKHRLHSHLEEPYRKGNAVFQG